MTAGLRPNFKSLLLMFGCQSLTSHKLYSGWNQHVTIPTNSLHLPALKSMHLAYVNFTTSDNDCAETFSYFLVLSTLVLEDFSLHNDA